MEKVYVVMHPQYKTIIAVFSDYETAMDLASTSFRVCLGDHEPCIEEYELDPLKDKLSRGVYPWCVLINAVTNETEVTNFNSGKLFTEESIDYKQGKFAIASVFAANEEEAENRASELWMSHQSGDQAVKEFFVYTVVINEEGEVEEVRRFSVYSQDPVMATATLKEASHGVSIRVPADSIDEAINIAREKYDEWIDEQVEQFEDLPY